MNKPLTNNFNQRKYKQPTCKAFSKYTAACKLFEKLDCKVVDIMFKIEAAKLLGWGRNTLARKAKNIQVKSKSKTFFGSL